MNWKEATLTPAQEKAWYDTRAALLWHAPAFSHIFYTLLQNNRSKYGAVFITDCADIPIAATDGGNLIFNVDKDGFFQFNLNQRVFIVVHEIFHCILNHPAQGHMFAQRDKVPYPDGTVLKYNHLTMNIAEDYVINAMIVESKIGQMPTDKNGKQMGCYDVNVGKHNDAALDVYRKLYKDPPKNPPQFDVKLAPGTSTGQSATQAVNLRNQAQWDTELRAAYNAAQSMNKLPACLKHVFEELMEPKIEWAEHIRSLFSRAIGGGQFDWQKPDRRMIVRGIYAPGRTGFGAGLVVIGVDTSGSITPKTVDAFLAEVSGILEDVNPEKIAIVWCDDLVRRVDECEDVDDLNIVRHKGAPGRGGTDFRPVFDRIGEEGWMPDALVYLTDGMGTFPTEPPPFPVIWGSIYPQSKYPFGDVVDIPVQAA